MMHTFAFYAAHLPICCHRWYKVSIVRITVGGRQLSINPSQYGKVEVGNAILDSGTTFSILPDPFVAAILNLVRGKATSHHLGLFVHVHNQHSVQMKAIPLFPDPSVAAILNLFKMTSPPPLCCRSNEMWACPHTRTPRPTLDPSAFKPLRGTRQGLLNPLAPSCTKGQPPVDDGSGQHTFKPWGVQHFLPSPFIGLTIP